MNVIDLNADLGEADNADGLAREARIIAYVSSANIACGGHAGDTASMAFMVKAAKANDTVIGAHPAYPDRENFGRRSFKLGEDISAADLSRSLTEQIVVLSEIAAKHLVAISYVKPHGALYNDAVFDAELADLIARTVYNLDPKLSLMGAPNSEMQKAANRYGLTFISEGFIDRRYTDDGHLQSRQIDGAVLKTQDERLKQLRQILTQNQVTTASGQDIDLNVKSLCLHGDSDGALETARQVQAAIKSAGFEIRSFAHG